MTSTLICVRSTLSRIPSLSCQWHTLPTAFSKRLIYPTSSTIATRAFRSSYCRQNIAKRLDRNYVSNNVETSASTTSETITTAATPTTQPNFQEDAKMAIAFTCTVPECGHRQAHVFSKRSYEKGIVIITCPGCKNRHLVADHLGWFENLTGDGAHVTIEKLAQAQGEKVARGTVGENGVFEFSGETPVNLGEPPKS